MFRENFRKNLVVGHLNINGFRNKFCEMYNVLNDGLVDIMGFSETKIDESFTNAQFNVNNFKMYRKDRNSRGGGLLFYARSDLPQRIRSDLECKTMHEVEHMVLEVILKREKFLFILMYNPPNIAKEHCAKVLSELLDKCLCECKSVFVLGDLNTNFLLEKHALCELLSMYNLSNVIQKPTCFKNASNPSLVDVLLTNAKSRVASHVNFCCGTSDFHNYVGVALKLHAPRQEPRTVVYRSYKKFNEGKFLTDLSYAPFHVCSVFDDVEDKLWFHNALLDAIVNEHAPLKRKKVKNAQLPYMNGELRKAINVKAMLKRKYHKCPANATWEKFRKQRNLVTTLKRNSLQKYFDERCNLESQNVKTFWRTMEPFLSDKKSKETSVILSKEDGSLIHDQRKVCNAFNQHFINTADDVTQNQIRCSSVEEVIAMSEHHESIASIRGEANPETSFSFQCVDSSQILREVKKLKAGASSGYDGIPVKVLKLGAEILSHSLRPIINECISMSLYPSDLKRAEVRPIFKKKDPMKAENYRPVSILTSVSKIFERIICEQMMNFFDNIFSPMIGAYRKKHSCANVLLKCTEDWKLSLDRGETVGCILMDLSKAFDVIPHDLLVSKLFAYGFTTDSCQLILSYLSHRPQRVKVGSSRSEWMCTKRGVPQGSIVGPILFNIFLNDLMFSLQNMCTIYNYADDNTLSFCHRDPSHVKATLEEAASHAIEWFKRNSMKVNPTKFQALVIYGARTDNKIECFNLSDGVEINVEKNVKLLGCFLDSKLNFSSHVHEVSKKCSRQINVIARLSHHLSAQCKLKIFQAFVLSNLDYCSVIYHHCGQTDAKELERIQKRFLRYVYLDFTSPYSELLKASKQTTLYERRIRQTLECIFKIKNDLMPPTQSSMFSIRQTTHNLRGTDLFIHPVFHNQYGQRSLRIQGPKLWSKLPDEWRCINDFKPFKDAVKNFKSSCRCGTCPFCTFMNL